MSMSRISMAGVLLWASAGAAQADSFTVTPALVSDYDLRGISQSAKEPAIQLGATYAHESGFYVGAWGSNINFGRGDPKMELDLTSGFTFGDAKESFAYDAGIIYYTYVGKSDYNYPEVYVGITRDWFNAKIFYSWDFNGVGNSAWYLTTTGTFPLPQDFAFIAHAGYSGGDYWDKAYGDGHIDWSVGVTKTVGKFTLGVSFIDGSDLKDGPGKVFDTRSKVVGSISTTLPWSAE
jgi:uncharacterized protein (TIGR02001 family)